MTPPRPKHNLAGVYPPLANAAIRSPIEPSPIARACSHSQDYPSGYPGPVPTGSKAARGSDPALHAGRLPGGRTGGLQVWAAGRADGWAAGWAAIADLPNWRELRVGPVEPWERSGARGVSRREATSRRGPEPWPPFASRGTIGAEVGFRPKVDVLGPQKE